MSYCRKHRHMATPDAMSGRCQECEIAALSEIAALREAYKRVRQEGLVGKHDDIIAGVIAKTRAEVLKEGAAALVEAREDIKALAAVLRAQTLGRSVPIYCDEQLAAWQRIRDRKLLEASDGE